MTDVPLTAAPDVDEGRRKFLTVAASGVAAFGAVVTVIPFVESWSPPSGLARSARPCCWTSASSSPGR